jgi:hypothetical protein
MAFSILQGDRLLCPRNIDKFTVNDTDCQKDFSRKYILIRALERHMTGTPLFDSDEVGHEKCLNLPDIADTGSGNTVMHI